MCLTSPALAIEMGKKAEPENRDLPFEFSQPSSCPRSTSHLKKGTSSASNATSGCRLSTSTANPVEAAPARTEAHTRTAISASAASRSRGNTALSVTGALLRTIDAIRGKFPEKIWDRNLQIRLSLRNRLALPRKLVNLRRNGLTLPRSRRK